MSRTRRITLAALLVAAIPCFSQGACDRRINIERSPLVNTQSGSWAGFLITDPDPACVSHVDVEFTVRETASVAQLWLDERTPSPTARRAIIRTDANGSGRIYFVSRGPEAFSIQATVVAQPNVGEIVQPILSALGPEQVITEGTRPIAARPGTVFANDLAVRVYDAGLSVRIGGQPVTFTTPDTEPTATFPNGQHTITVIANPFGLASTTLTAGTETGSFPVTASVSPSRPLRLEVAVGNASTTRLTLPANPGVVEDNLSVQVTLAGLAPGVPLPPVGALRVAVDNVPIQPSFTYAAGTGIYALLPRQSLGTHSVIAAYAGDAVYGASQSDVVTFEVKPDAQLATPDGSVGIKIFPGLHRYHLCPLQGANVLAATDPKLPAAPPSISGFPGGVIEYTLSNCWQGYSDDPTTDAPRVLLHFDKRVDPDAVVWQYSRATDAPKWHVIESSIQGNEVMVQFDRVSGDDGTRSALGNGGIVHGYLAVGTRPPQWPPNVQDLWWAGPAENGWGMTISQQEDRLFVGLFVYDESGAPRWYVISGGTWDASNSTFTGSLYQPTGPSWRAYKPGVFQVGAPVGSGSIRFTDRDHAVFSYEIGGLRGKKSIQRQLFGPPGLIQPPGAGLWWGYYGEPGWGIAVAQQNSKRFAVWFTYDDAGKTTWMVAPDLSPWVTQASAQDSASTGPLYTTRGSPWLGAAYDPTKFAVIDIGTFPLGITAYGSSGGFNVVQGTTTVVQKPLARQPF